MGELLFPEQRAKLEFATDDLQEAELLQAHMGNGAFEIDITSAREAGFTPAEARVLMLGSLGLSTAQISGATETTNSTTTDHLANVAKKFDTHTRAASVHCAFKGLFHIREFATKTPRLKPLEADVLKSLAAGRSQIQVASEMNLPVETVTTAVHDIREKYQMRANVAGLITYRHLSGHLGSKKRFRPEEEKLLSSLESLATATESSETADAGGLVVVTPEVLRDLVAHRQKIRHLNALAKRV